MWCKPVIIVSIYEYLPYSVLVICFGDEIADARDFLVQAHSAGMTGNDYAYIAIWVSNTFAQLPWEYGDDKDELMRKLFSKILVVSHL